MLNFVAFTTPPRIELVAGPVLSAEHQAKVDELWRGALTDRPDLFDGPIMTVVELAADRLVVAAATYRRIVAGRHDPALRPRPLAVSGILLCADGVVFGRRGRNVTQAPGLWELVPSGGAKAPPDLARDILEELREEIGLGAEIVSLDPAIGAIADADSGVVDIVIPIRTALTGEAVLAAHAAAGSTEYDSLAIAAQPHAFAAGRADILPASRLILDRLRGER